MLDLIVEHQAGIPILTRPLRGHTNDASDFGQVVTHHRAHLQTAHSLAYPVADSALYRAENFQQFTQTSLTWITRVPATLTEAQDMLATADPEAMLPLMEGYRYQLHTSHDGGIAQRWVLIYAERRRPQAQRTIDQDWLHQRTAVAKAFQKLCGTALACEADAQQALHALMQDLQATCLQEVTIRPASRDAKWGRPGKTMPPTPLIYHIDGAITSSLATRHALVAQKSCFILATNALDSPTVSPLELLEGYQGQKFVERGFRF
jgi:transposase